MSSRPKFIDIHKGMPLPLKMVVLTIIVSLSVWIILDHVQTSKLKDIYYAQLTENLHNDAMESRIGFDHYIKNFQSVTTVIVSQKKFSNYIENQAWAATDTVEIKYNRQSPSWFPNHSVIRTLAQPRYALLLDPGGRTREVYQDRKNSIPLSLLNPTQLLIHKSQGQTFMTRIDEVPYAISSKSYLNPKGQLQAILILAFPIDNTLLQASQKYYSEEHLVALLTNDKDPRVMTSNNLEKLPVGAPLSTLQTSYLITGTEFFDYGASEIQIKFTNFISLAEIEKMTNVSISLSRQDRAITAFTLIIVFTLIIYWITRHINIISKHINSFSHKTLGMKPRSMKKGDQLYVLKERFLELTTEIIETRETIKNQAEEKTRLIVKNAFDAIATTDAKGIISTWNQTAETLFGWKADEVIGMPIYDVIVPPGLHEECVEPIKNIITDNKDHTYRCQVILSTYHRKGDLIPVEFSVSSAMQGNGYVLIFTMRDTTESSRSEKRIHHLLATLTKAKDDGEAKMIKLEDEIQRLKTKNSSNGNGSEAASLEKIPESSNIFAKKIY